MSRAYLGFVIALLACTRSESREGATDQQVQRPLVMKSARDTVAWLSTTQLDLPHREKLIASPNGFATQPSLHTAHGLSRQGMTVELPARATGTTRLSSTLRQDVWMDVVADDLDIASTAESTGDALVFRGVRPVTDVVQLVGGDRFEELRVVHGAADSIEGRWKIHLGPGLADLVVVDGQIRARSADGYAWFQSYPLWVVDSAGTRRPASAQATSNGADATLVVRADAKGLVPPIALDPSFTSGGVLPGTVQAVGSVIKLASGKVLIAYGQPGTFVAYLYDPSTNTAVTAPGLTSITYSTWGVVGAALGDGRAAFSAEVYNGTTTTAFTPVDSEFDTPVAVGLPSGGVLVTGGRGSNTNNITEIVSGSPATAKKVADAPYYNYGVANGNAKGTLVGGKVAIYQPGSSYGIEVYTPTTDAWTSTLSPGSYRPTMMAVAALPGDHVLVAGGTAPSSGVATAYSYDIAAKSWAALPDMGTKRTGFEAVGFTNGALVIGGQMYDSATSTTTYHSSSEFYDVGSGTWSAGPSLANPRSNYLLGPIGAGKILVAGGRDSTSSLSSVEILNAAAPGTSCASATVCESGLTCVDATCCTTSTCPAGSKCSYALGKGTCRKDNGQTCTTAGECGTGFCVEGVCCDSACGATGTCKAAGKVGKCTKLEAQPCASSAECASNFCADGVCCDALCSGTCEACSAAKKGAGVDGKCGPIAADTDPDNECPTDSGFPASCKAD
ncbi:MAG: hypothetical protein ACXVEE_19005, partial [Polyangiales bacterium]